jgi:molybdenum cofactor biosynthesis protein MoaC
MKDISKKYSTFRTASAQATLKILPETSARIKANDLPKKDPFPVARVAAVQAAKRTADLIPYCHQVPLDHVSVDFEIEDGGIKITVTAKATAKTGVEMEALTGASMAALTLYDMLKPIDDSLEIGGVRLVQKTGGKSDFACKPSRLLTAAVLVTSDRAARGEREDLTGPFICRRLTERGFEVVDHSVVADDPATIENVLTRYARDLELDLVITTGGTGMAPRDHTPEVTSSIIDKPLPGIAEAVRAFGLARTPYAMLSGGIAGIAGKTLIVNLPGSRRAVEDSLEVLFPAIIHGIAVIEGEEH